MPGRWSIALFGVGIATLWGCAASAQAPYTRLTASGIPGKIVAGARKQLENPARYDANYRRIPYPGGDVAPDRGVCTDVVIRALRHAGFDLQKLIREDMRTNLSKYPRRGERPDTNIDHRRVPNQRFFLSRYGLDLTVRTDGDNAKTWKPGDIVAWKLDSGLDHVGVISDTMGSNGLPMVIHNISRTAEEDVLESWKITGHYRFPKR